MHSSALFLLSVLSAAFALEVTTPATHQGWTNNGPQTVTWKHVSTDPSTFSIVLTNQNRALLASDIVLASSVNAASGGRINVNPPSGGWPSPGFGYRVNLVQQSTVLAQSTDFNIVNGPATVIGTDGAAGASPTGTSSNGPGGSTFGGGTVTFPPPRNNTDNGTGNGNGAAASSVSLSVGLLAGVAALVGSVLV